MVDRCDVTSNAAEAKRSMAHEFDLVVHAFERAVGDPPSGPGQHACEVPPPPANEILAGFQPRAPGRVHPAAQVVGGSTRLAVVPEELQGFLEVIGPHAGGVPAPQGGEALPFVRAQVPGILEQPETGLLKRSFCGPAPPTPCTLPDFIQRAVQRLDPGKAVWAFAA